MKMAKVARYQDPGFYAPVANDTGSMADLFLTKLIDYGHTKMDMATTFSTSICKTPQLMHILTHFCKRRLFTISKPHAKWTITSIHEFGIKRYLTMKHRTLQQYKEVSL